MSKIDKIKIVMLALFPTFVTVNPEIEKFQYVTNYIDREMYYSDEIFDLKTKYLVNNKSDSKFDLLKEKIYFFRESFEPDIRISSEVINNSYNLLNILSPLMLEKLDLDNVYTTPYGTLVLDWEEDEDNVFSLELGADKIGYFIEKDGFDVKRVDAILLEDNKNELLQDLSFFLF